jgi:hypothetical protein
MCHLKSKSKSIKNGIRQTAACLPVSNFPFPLLICKLMDPLDSGASKLSRVPAFSFSPTEGKPFRELESDTSQLEAMERKASLCSS